MAHSASGGKFGEPQKRAPQGTVTAEKPGDSGALNRREYIGGKWLETVEVGPISTFVNGGFRGRPFIRPNRTADPDAMFGNEQICLYAARRMRGYFQVRGAVYEN
jgi:hypothetical protein